MKISTLVLSLFLILFCNCKNEPKEKVILHRNSIETNNSPTYPMGSVITTVSCQKDPSVTYALYLPTSYTQQKKYPVIFFFDAHARGNKPLKLYSQLADKYNFIFAGSNNSKNGIDNQTLGELIAVTMNDVIEKFSIDPVQIYTSGFSGGAKVASIAAFGSPQIKGVIACAAAMPVELLTQPLNFDYIAIAGLEDFNYREMAVQDQQLKNITHDFFVFKGGHEWAPVNVMDKAIRKMISNAMETGRKKKDERFITETSKFLKDSLIHINYSAAQQEQEKKLQQQYMKALGEKDKSWWVKETKMLHEKTKQKNNAAYTYKRILNYLSMACYSFVNKGLVQNQAEATGHYVSVYELIDPNNPDVYYFKAILFAKQGKNQETVDALKKSVELGLDDIEKVKSEFAFNNIRNTDSFEELIIKISENPAR